MARTLHILRRAESLISRMTIMSQTHTRRDGETGGGAAGTQLDENFH
jgi:hypothetical protein